MSPSEIDDFAILSPADLPVSLETSTLRLHLATHRQRFAVSTYKPRIVYPGDSADTKEHRKRIFAFCGDRELKPLAVRSSGLGRLGRVNQSQSAETPLKTSLLGRLGRLFQTHSGTELTHAGENDDRTTEKLNDFKGGVPAVLSAEVRSNRPLTDHELLLLRRAGAENDPLIISALNLFDATVVE